MIASMICLHERNHNISTKICKCYFVTTPYADSAYSGEKIDTKFKERDYQPQICEKGYRNKPLTEEQKESNRLKSKVRCRIEHIFGAQKMRMGNEVLRSIGLARTRFLIGMRNLMYNMSRLVSLKRPKPAK